MGLQTFLIQHSLDLHTFQTQYSAQLQYFQTLFSPEAIQRSIFLKLISLKHQMSSTIFQRLPTGDLYHSLKVPYLYQTAISKIL